jgi:hypothetical protein
MIIMEISYPIIVPTGTANDQLTKDNDKTRGCRNVWGKSDWQEVTWQTIYQLVTDMPSFSR